MKAAIYAKYGPPDVVRIADIPTPTPKPGEVLVAIRATTISAADWRARALKLPAGFGLIGRLIFGITGPRRPVLGMAFAGDIVALGKGVTNFAIGDAVYGSAGMRMGCHAEYALVRANAAIVAKPASLSYQDAACLPFGPVTALQFLRDKAKIQPGAHVLVNGATGAVGSAAVQLARHFGGDVTAICSAANADLARSLGAETVIDYQTTDLAQIPARFDIIVDCAGTMRFARHKHLLNPNGRLLMVLATMGQMLRAPFNSRAQGKRAVNGVAQENSADLALLADLVAMGALVPLIDSRYPLDDIVTAHARVDTGRKRGNVVILP